MTVERLNELMWKKYPHIPFDSKQAKEYLECCALNANLHADEDTLVYHFAMLMLCK